MKTRSIVVLLFFFASTTVTFSQEFDNSSRTRSLSEFKTAPGVRAVLKNFFYETQFQVISFDIIFSGEGFDDPIFYSNVGAAWDPNCRQYMSRCRVGTEIMIENIKVLGPDNRTRKLKDILAFQLR